MGFLEEKRGMRGNLPTMPFFQNPAEALWY